MYQKLIAHTERMTAREIVRIHHRAELAFDRFRKEQNIDKRRQLYLEFEAIMDIWRENKWILKS